MLHPSYTELMEKINQENLENDEQPVVNSRYSIVIASAKRARQLIGGKDPLITGVSGVKPLSIAVKELYGGQISITSEGEDDDTSLVAEETFESIEEDTVE